MRQWLAVQMNRAPCDPSQQQALVSCQFGQQHSPPPVALAACQTIARGLESL